MKRLFSTSLFLLLVLLMSTLASFSQDFDYSKYKPRTLSELVELNPNPPRLESEKKVALISGDWFHSQVRLKYIGTPRPLSSKRKEIINNWKTSFRIPTETANLFDKEFLFKECDNEFWLPVQTKVSSYFQKELKEGDIVTVYLFLAGGLKVAGKWDLLFLVNEFEK